MSSIHSSAPHCFQTSWVILIDARSTWGASCLPTREVSSDPKLLPSIKKSPERVFHTEGSTLTPWTHSFSPSLTFAVSQCRMETICCMSRGWGYPRPSISRISSRPRAGGEEETGGYHQSWHRGTINTNHTSTTIKFQQFRDWQMILGSKVTTIIKSLYLVLLRYCRISIWDAMRNHFFLTCKCVDLFSLSDIHHERPRKVQEVPEVNLAGQ